MPMFEQESSNIHSAPIDSMLERLEGRVERGKFEEATAKASIASMDKGILEARKIIDSEEFNFDEADPGEIIEISNAWVAWGSNGVFEGENYADLRKEMQLYLGEGGEAPPRLKRFARQIWRTSMTEYIIQKLDSPDCERSDRADLTEKMMASQIVSETEDDPIEALTGAMWLDKAIESRDVRVGLAAKMDASTHNGLSITDIPKQFKGYNPTEVKVVVGGELLTIPFALTEAFLFKKLVLDVENNRVYGQMENGCRGNLVIIELGGPPAVTDGPVVGPPLTTEDKPGLQTGPTPEGPGLMTGPTPEEPGLMTGPTPEEPGLMTGPIPEEPRLQNKTHVPPEEPPLATKEKPGLMAKPTPEEPPRVYMDIQRTEEKPPVYLQAKIEQTEEEPEKVLNRMIEVEPSGNSKMYFIDSSDVIVEGGEVNYHVRSEEVTGELHPKKRYLIVTPKEDGSKEYRVMRNDEIIDRWSGDDERVSGLEEAAEVPENCVLEEAKDHDDAVAKGYIIPVGAPKGDYKFFDNSKYQYVKPAPDYEWVTPLDITDPESLGDEESWKFEVRLKEKAPETIEEIDWSPMSEDIKKFQAIVGPLTTDKLDATTEEKLNTIVDNLNSFVQKIKESGRLTDDQIAEEIRKELEQIGGYYDETGELYNFRTFYKAENYGYFYNLSFIPGTLQFFHTIGAYGGKETVEQIETINRDELFGKLAQRIRVLGKEHEVDMEIKPWMKVAETKDIVALTKRLHVVTQGLKDAIASDPDVKDQLANMRIHLDFDPDGGFYGTYVDRTDGKAVLYINCARIHSQEEITSHILDQLNYINDKDDGDIPSYYLDNLGEKAGVKRIGFFRPRGEKTTFNYTDVIEHFPDLWTAFNEVREDPYYAEILADTTVLLGVPSGRVFRKTEGVKEVDGEWVILIDYNESPSKIAKKLKGHLSTVKGKKEAEEVKAPPASTMEREEIEAHFQEEMSKTNRRLSKNHDVKEVAFYELTEYSPETADRLEVFEKAVGIAMERDETTRKFLENFRANFIPSNSSILAEYDIENEEFVLNFDATLFRQGDAQYDPDRIAEAIIQRVGKFNSNEGCRDIIERLSYSTIGNANLPTAGSMSLWSNEEYNYFNIYKNLHKVYGAFELLNERLDEDQKKLLQQNMVIFSEIQGGWEVLPGEKGIRKSGAGKNMIVIDYNERPGKIANTIENALEKLAEGTE